MQTARTRAYTPAGVLAASCGVLAFGAGIVIIKETTSPFLVVAFWRHVFALPVLFVAWRLSKDRTFPWRTAGLGGLLFALHQLAHLSALRYSTAAVVTVFFAMQPIIVGAFGRRFVGEHATPSFFAWSGVAIVGCAIVVFASADQPHASALGTMLAVANLLVWSTYYVASKKARATMNTISWLFVMILVSTIVIAVLAVAFHEPFGRPFSGDSHEWVLLLILAMIPGTAGHFLVTWAQPRIHVAASSALQLGVPIVASIGAAIFVHERFGPVHAIGALLAIGGAIAAMRHLPPPVTEEAATTFEELAT
jgi:drug/metabolite transporter (DMT)-like permease